MSRKREAAVRQQVRREIVRILEAEAMWDQQVIEELLALQEYESDTYEFVPFEQPTDYFDEGEPDWGELSPMLLVS